MSAYLSADLIADAVGRLGRSAARSRLGDYLIVKRALSRQGAMRGPLELSQASDIWVESIRDLAAIRGDVAWTGPNYFNPFGAARDGRTRGFRSDKYTSNGSSNTVMDWHGKADSPIERVPPMRPAHIAIREDLTSDQMSRWFLLRNDEAGRPDLLDAAVWWFRSTDLDATGLAHSAEITTAFVDALRLTDLEITTLFSSAADADLVLRVDDFPARPSEYLPKPPTAARQPQTFQGQPEDPETPSGGPLSRPLEEMGEAVADLIRAIDARGFSFQPWQIAAFVTAVRTKPLVLLAGISGTGKTALPRLIAETTGATSQTVAVRPDWTDSSDLIGRQTLNETFIPGSLLRACREATEVREVERFFVLDEMNIARVEYYMAEVLSRIEERRQTELGPVTREPLISGELVPPEWEGILMPGNIALIGSVNMDESTHDFSRKVMDRSFIIEFSDVDLNAVPSASEQPPEIAPWPVEWWRQKHLRLADLDQTAHADIILRTVGALSAANEHLSAAQLQVGYRVRDEIAMFVVNAQDCIESFVDQSGAIVDPLDLAISLKVLPRIIGGELTIRSVLEGLLRWAEGESEPEVESESEPEAGGDGVEPADRTTKDAWTPFPVCARRIRMMLDRMIETGYASYWT